MAAPLALIQVSALTDDFRSNCSVQTAYSDPSHSIPDAALLDLRHLPAPEPMWRILDALSKLAPGRVLRARTPRLPLPLIKLLEREGHAVDIDASDTGDDWVTIRVGDGGTRA